MPAAPNFTTNMSSSDVDAHPAAAAPVPEMNVQHLIAILEKAFEPQKTVRSVVPNDTK
jgi:hypothetical protein